jgi:serine/threonine protein kinase
MKTPLDQLATRYLHRRIQSIRLIREIGRGARSIVFAGFQESLARKVAVKIFPKTTSRGEAADNPEQREAAILSTLQHPNIIRLLGHGELNDCCYLVMPLYEGGSLRTLIRRYNNNFDGSNKKMPLSACHHLMSPILDALSCVHDHGMVHGDLKPSNILIDVRGVPCLADLGCAGAAGRAGIAGSALYMSPEQAAGRGLDPRSDIYSIGVVLFEMAAGWLPVESGSRYKIIQCKRTAPETFFTETPRKASSLISEPLERIIRRATAAQPVDRYADCRALASDLADLRLSGES